MKNRLFSSAFGLNAFLFAMFTIFFTPNKLLSQSFREALLQSANPANPTSAFDLGTANIFANDPSLTSIAENNSFQFSLLGIERNVNSGYAGQTTLLGQTQNVHLSSATLTLVGRTHNFNWPVVNFKIGYNLLGTFNRNVSWIGDTTGSIILDMFNNLDQNNPESDEFYTGLGINTGGIYVNGDTWTTDFKGYEDVKINHSQFFKERGSIGEVPLILGTRYQDGSFALSLAGGAGFQFLNRSVESEYWEGNLSSTVPNFNSLNFTESYSVFAKGWNFKGSVAGVWRGFKVIVSGQTATRLNFQERDYHTFMRYSFLGPSGTEEYEAESPYGSSNYTIKTAPEVKIGVVLSNKKIGHISAGVQRIFYDKMLFESDEHDFGTQQFYADLSRQIRLQFTSVTNFAIGGELKLGHFRLGAGAKWFGNPEPNFPQKNTPILSGVVGYDFGQVNLRVAYSESKSFGKIWPYPNGVEVGSDYHTKRLALTLGFKFGQN